MSYTPLTEKYLKPRIAAITVKGTMPNIIDILEKRGFIEAISSEELRTAVNQPLKVYCGFDPTADSLHLGHMVALMGLAWFQKLGHTPVAIVGGATGMIGDPSGKAKERQLLDAPTIEKNILGIRKNLETLLSFDGSNKAVILNNYDWFSKFSFIDFLRDVGKLFRVGPMLSKESVKVRLNSDEGMSFTEFSYQILQGYDFLYLNQNHGVTLQMGGSDQWGNITAGTELIRKVNGEAVYGLTFPLLTRSDGKKFGKTEQGTVWLSADRQSPYDFYQYLYRMPDEDVLKMMRLLTFMELEEIESIGRKMKEADYVVNSAQKRLAEEVTRLVHGEEGLQLAQKVTDGLKPGAATELNPQALESLAANIPTYQVKKADFTNAKLIDLIASLGILASKGDVRRLIRNGGMYLNNQQIQDENVTLNAEHLIDHHLLLVAIGKKNKVLIRVE